MFLYDSGLMLVKLIPNSHAVVLDLIDELKDLDFCSSGDAKGTLEMHDAEVQFGESSHLRGS